MIRTESPTEPRPTTPRLLYRAEVREITRLPYTSLARAVRQGRFPKPIQIGLRRLAWLEPEVLDWLRARVQDRDTASICPAQAQG